MTKRKSKLLNSRGLLSIICSMMLSLLVVPSSQAGDVVGVISIGYSNHAYRNHHSDRYRSQRYQHTRKSAHHAKRNHYQRGRQYRNNYYYRDRSYGNRYYKERRYDRPQRKAYREGRWDSRCGSSDRRSVSKEYRNPRNQRDYQKRDKRRDGSNRRRVAYDDQVNVDTRVDIYID